MGFKPAVRFEPVRITNTVTGRGPTWPQLGVDRRVNFSTCCCSTLLPAPVWQLQPSPPLDGTTAAAAQHNTMKYVLVTGGVVSGLGKGVTASSIGVLLKNCGLRVTSIKIGKQQQQGCSSLPRYGGSDPSIMSYRPIPQH
jgi:hypothetical protein